MRTLCATAFLSVDGVVESPSDWIGPYLTPAVDEEMLDILDDADAFLFGRTTFQEMAGYWRERTGPMADIYNEKPKHVVSTTLWHTRWPNSQIISADVAARVAELKAGGEGPLMIVGSATLVRALTEAELIDEYRFLMAPVVLGKGKRLFPDGLRLPLTLTDAKIYESGVAQLLYTPARS